VPKRDNTIKEDIFKFYNIQENFKVKKIYSFDFLRFEKINKFFIYIQALLFAFAIFFHVLFNLEKFGRDDIFYLRDEFSPWLLILLNKKVFLEIHAFTKRFRYYRIFFPKISGLILITKKAKEKFIDLGMVKEKILIAPDGVDLNIFDLDLSKDEARKKFNLPLDKKLLGYTGRFRTMGMDKGIYDILKALKILNDNEIIFIAIGGLGADIDHYTKKAREAEIEKQIKLLPFRSQSQLAVYQKAFDILLMPFPPNEHYTFYMSPLKMFEYMASGRPIVTSDLPSVREILNENNAIFVKPEDPEDLARGIKTALEDKELAQRVSQQAFEDVQFYTWTKRAERIVRFIKEKI